MPLLGLIVNLEDEQLPADSPWRTHEEERDQSPLFVLHDGCPVYEVWMHRMGRWWCYSHAPDPALAAQGVVYFNDLQQLKAQIAYLLRSAA